MNSNRNNKNLLIAAVVLMAFFFVWDKFVVRRYAPVRPQNAAAAKAQAGKTPEAPAAIAPASATPADAQNGLRPFGIPETLSTATEEVTFESKGARVTSWKRRERDHWVEFVFPNAPVHPLETFPDLYFSFERKSASEAVFLANHPSGARIRKTVSLRSDAPFHTVSVELSNPGGTPARLDGALAWGSGLNKQEEGASLKATEPEAAKAESRAIAWAGDMLRSWTVGFITDRSFDRADTGPFAWVGVDNHHFLAAFVATSQTPIETVRVSGSRDHAPSVQIPLSADLMPGAVRTSAFDLYVGPKKHDELKQLGVHLEESVNFGFFGPISKALLYALQYLRDLTGNWGWAIVILTIGLQILVFPLTRKNLDHAARMKVLQPQLKKLQEQFKGDPKRLQIETLNLYKKNGMRFMGMEGCVPILAQIPIFIALFNTLQSAYELRGAPWILWINDLSHHDPYYVLPILMGLGMYAQQKLTTVPTDPAQAKMMLFMPVIMTVMFHKLPAGLVLYWVVNSIMTILIQWFLLRLKKPEPVAA